MITKQVRSLLPTERLEELDGRLAMTDEGSTRVRYVKFWVDEAPSSAARERSSPLDEELPTHASYPREPVPPFPNLSARDGAQAPPSPERRERLPQDHTGQGAGFSPGSRDFGGGVRFEDGDMYERGRIPGSARSQTKMSNAPRIPPQDNVPRGCSLHSMEPL